MLRDRVRGNADQVSMWIGGPKIGVRAGREKGETNDHCRDADVRVSDWNLGRRCDAGAFTR